MEQADFTQKNHYTNDHYSNIITDVRRLFRNNIDGLDQSVLEKVRIITNEINDFTNRLVDIPLTPDIENYQQTITNLRNDVGFFLENIFINILDKPSEANKPSVITSYDPARDCFGDSYTLLSSRGLAAGCNGGVEKVAFRGPDGAIRFFALKTLQPIITTINLNLEKQIPGITQQGGAMDDSNSLGWIRCTQREKLALLDLFGNKNPNYQVRSVAALESSMSLEEVQEIRKIVFGSYNEGAERIPDIYIKAMGALGRKYFDDLRDMVGNVYVGEDDLEKEAVIYKYLDSHPNVLKMFSYGCKPASKGEVGGKYLVMELAQTNLANFLHERPNMPLGDKLTYAIQIAEGLAYLKSLGILHRDLKLDNILVGMDEQLKITDFGTATIIGEEEGAGGNPMAVPPEYGLQGIPQMNYDSWGLGFVLLELMSSPDKRYAIREFFTDIDPLIKAYSHILKMTNNSNTLQQERTRFINVLTTGNDGLSKHTLDSIIFDEAPEEDRIILQTIKSLIIGLLDPDYKERFEPNRAVEELRKILLNSRPLT